MKNVVVIPAYNPPTALIRLVGDLIDSDIEAVVVVDDGSDPKSKPVFDRVDDLHKVVLLRHVVNQGKGGALKTAFNYVYLHYPDADGVVTADADGQHCVKDILGVANTLSEEQNSLILGVRSLDNQVPFRSLLGNKLTKLVFRFVLGKQLSDTQTGLRGIPIKLLPDLLRIPTMGYDFELDMLITALDKGLNFTEIPIRTIYLERNLHSHFNPLLDSFKIYMVFIRFVGGSLITAMVDYLFFIIVLFFSSNILLSQGIARTFAVGVNFFLAKKYVFRVKNEERSFFLKFLILTIGLGLISYAMITVMVAFFGIGVLTAKISAELILYILNFSTQREVVFRKDD